MELSLKKPEWIKVRPPSGENYLTLKKTLRAGRLVTVCEEARCPNVGECWNTGTATFMLLGDTCTRTCGFCAVKTGNPLGSFDKNEPQNIAQAVTLMGLKYVVLTTVDRDDLPDFGASHIARVVSTIKSQCHTHPLIEVLAGDFRAHLPDVKTVCHSQPHVFAHNLETVERLTPYVRDRRASFAKSLDVLRCASKTISITKSSLMVGLGETYDEVIDAMKKLRDVGVSIITIGQYLQPTAKHLPVIRYVTPDEFGDFRTSAYDLGFRFVAAGPLVRSSYRAAEQFIEKAFKPKGIAHGH